MSDPRKQLEEGVHPEIVWEDYHAGKNPIDVLCDHLDEIESLRTQLASLERRHKMAWSRLHFINHHFLCAQQDEREILKQNDNEP